MTDTFFGKNPLKSFIFKGYGKIKLNQLKYFALIARNKVI
jgi:hypothetical protein